MMPSMSKKKREKKTVSPEIRGQGREKESQFLTYYNKKRVEKFFYAMDQKFSELKIWAIG